MRRRRRRAGRRCVIVPSSAAYLIHDLPKLRNALDLLLANLGNPEVVTSPIGEYASENPVKPRPYEVLLEELVEE